MLVNPLLKESVRDLQRDHLPIQREKLDRFDPYVKILLTDSFLQRIDDFRPQVLHSSVLMGNDYGKVVGNGEPHFGLNILDYGHLQVSFHKFSTIVDKWNKGEI